MGDRTCSVDECTRVVHSFMRCKPHRYEMSSAEVLAARAEFIARQSAAKLGPSNPQFGKTGTTHRNWKADSVGYFGIHDWMTARYGQPVGCEICATDDPAKRYEWANISGEYHRDRADFMRLCKKCHNDLDGVNAYEVGAPPRRNRAMGSYGGKPVSSPYKGVRASGYGTWLACLTVDKKRKNLGTFKTEEGAARAYNAAVREAYGEDAYMNDIRET